MFSSVVLPLCFQNNDYLALTTSQFEDSGSIMTSIFQLMDSSNLYNQNVPYHTAYGYPFNSILFWIFIVLRNLFNLSVTTDFFIFATIARLVNFSIAIFSLCIGYLLAKRIYLRDSTTLLFLFFFSLFPPFILYAVQIKPDLLGVLFIQCSLWHLLNFLESEKEKSIVVALVFAGLATMTKQPFVYWCIPLLLGTLLINSKSLSKQALLTRLLRIILRTLTLILPLIFIIHPYAILDPVGLMNKQIFLLNENASADIVVNVRTWTMIILDNVYLLPLIFIPFISVLIPHKSELNKKRTILLAIYVLIYIVWLITRVGPMRAPAYFLMIIIPGAILVFQVYESITIRIKTPIFYTTAFFLCLFTVFHFFYPYNLQYVKRIRDYKKSNQYKTVKLILQNNKLYDTVLNSRVIFSVSIPLPTHNMSQAVNT